MSLYKLASALVLCLVCTFQTFAQQGGWLDLRQESLFLRPSRLDGVWEFYPNHLYQSATIPNGNKSTAPFPSLWRASQKIDFGTYRLKILLPPSAKRKELAIEVPHFFSSYALYENGKLLGKNGEPGKTKETTLPAWRPDLYTFVSESDTLDLVLQVANFYHVTGGTRKSLRIAEAFVLTTKHKWIQITDYVLLITLAIIGLASLCFYYIMRDQRNPFLFLCLFVIAWALHSACSNQYRILEWVNISWEWMVKLEHLTIFFTIITALLFVSSLFPKDFDNKWLKVLFPSLAVAFSIFSLVAEPITFTAYLFVYMLVAICLIAYVIMVIVKAFIYERAGSTIMLVTILLGSLTFGYVVLSYLAIIEINMFIYNLSFIILYSMLTVSMSVRLAKLSTENEGDVLTFDQLYKDKLV